MNLTKGFSALEENPVICLEGNAAHQVGYDSLLQEVWPFCALF